MAVEVQLTNGHQPTHDTGEYVEVIDGHLFVKKGEGQVVSVYAPERWSHATAT
jgi:hypothetical protein